MAEQSLEAEQYADCPRDSLLKAVRDHRGHTSHLWVISVQLETQHGLEPTKTDLSAVSCRRPAALPSM